MKEFFNASEILEFALRIEENGEQFYRLMAEKFSTKEIKNIFNYLADEEVKHKQIFKDMLSKVEPYQPPQSYPDEYFLYLRSYANEHIFTKEKTGQLMAKKIKTAQEAIKFAIAVELDSILYYLEARNLVPEQQRTTIDKVADEERRHYLRLQEVKRGL